VSGRWRLGAALAAAWALLGPATAGAEIERVATPCGAALCERVWPRLTVPAGWRHNRDVSLRYHFNALSPEDESFLDAVTVMYATAVPRAAKGSATNLDDFIRQQNESFAREAPERLIQRGAELLAADGRASPTWWLRPHPGGQWERLAYLADDEHFIVFVISSRSEADLLAHMAAFESLVTRYRR
jgi:hypothetical protein